MSGNELNLFVKNENQQNLYDNAASFIESFKQRAADYDRKAMFPIENMNELKAKGMTTLTIPKKYGGNEISLYDFLLVQETLAQGDAATALSLGWHNGTMMQLRDTKKWPESIFEQVSHETVRNHLLINSAATEPATGSPARGGKPETTATKSSNSWVINGKKTFTSLAPMLDYIIVTATITDQDQIGEFLLPRNANGITFEETWDTMGMRATRSDDLILNEVTVDESALVSLKDPGHGTSPQGWLLHIPACYLGIAITARNDAVSFAKEYQPNSLNHPISEVPEVRRKIAEMDLELMKARHFMYHVAEIWDTSPELRSKLGGELAAVKTVCTNAAVKVVDLTMRLVGGQSLHRSKPFERYYRDVRAGLHNPPSDDLTFMALGNRAIDPKN
ncbi:acyl-CoA dehydrogenase [Salipaludibacillus keqinensis]|uniref:Acyl-CoA dehydrogenase n=1 Tax=Salipaludibacillus keqinensis TaxID=2045207 RepID=A0A323TSP6_9BACI|nr:acyl-CoA dehydrogenase family protein [Salipaludibacillus keqinensis]PYZ92455.1 acyl-CoA dehydrogenase [Salipaludibacillus keqinensis]